MRSILRLAFAVSLLLPSVALAAPKAPKKPPKGAPKLVRVPQDAKDLQTAIKTVADGGIIELAANTYATPPKGFSIANKRKGFTVRAAGPVVLDGGGARLLLRYENGQLSRGKLVTFEGITFRNGASLTEGYAGGVTLSAAQARFVGCIFENNRATGRTSGGGAVRVLKGSEASFAGTVFRGNSSLNRGGAIEVILSTATIEGGELVDNRVNLPGHKATSAGGAVYAVDSILRVSGARFQGNQAGWVGGAIYGFGRWGEPLATPKTLVQVTRSTFIANSAEGLVPAPSATTGGAIHVEDQATLEVASSVFTGNAAQFGGAIDNYRAITVVHGSWFQGNRALPGNSTGAGGAIFATSPDFADSSTGFGAINRRSARLILSDTLFQGGGTVAHTGGCVLVAGDESRAFGLNGVPAAGTLEENRARVEMRRTVFSDCDVATAPQGGAGTGGAVQAVLVDLLMEDSLVIGSHAQIAGGGLALERDSNAVISGTTFANDSAQTLGGALFIHGSTAQVTGSAFLGNRGADNRGSAIFSIPLTHPAFPRNAGGLVSDSSFSDNAGIPIFDAPAAGPVNLMRYNGNQFFLGDRVYAGNFASPNGISAAELNNLQAKSDGGNERLTAAPRLGTVVGVPPFLGAGAGASDGKAFLAYAWSGRSATLAGQALSGKAGLLEIAAPGDYFLDVDGGPMDSTRIAASVSN